jgi:hypothetical protein
MSMSTMDQNDQQVEVHEGHGPQDDGRDSILRVSAVDRKRINDGTQKVCMLSTVSQGTWQRGQRG